MVRHCSFTLRNGLCMQVEMSSGLLATAHDQGELRVYQFSTESRELAVAAVDVAAGGKRRGSDEEPLADQPPGFQHVLRVQAPQDHAVTALALSPHAGLLGACGSGGQLIVVDLLQVEVTYCCSLCCISRSMAWSCHVPAMKHASQEASRKHKRYILPAP